MAEPSGACQLLLTVLLPRLADAHATLLPEGPLLQVKPPLLLV